ncbi:MAG TPA: hypothetical protein VHP83_21325 [Aggregatilineaceae bacterium]|nr:hypothetical protein [Aggregatilineaceae bacterium]
MLDVHSFSSDLHYYFRPTNSKRIIDAQTNAILFSSESIPQEKAGWSIGGTYLAFMDGTQACLSANDEGNLILFDAVTETISRLCIPFGISDISALQWSPFEDGELAILGPNVLLNVISQETTSFKVPSELDAADVKRYVGYDRTLWDPATGCVAAWLKDDFSISYESAPEGTYLYYSLEACSGGGVCVPLVDTLNVANSRAFDRQLYGHWLLWGGYENASNQPLFFYSQTAPITAAVIYLTDLQTGITQELFRYFNPDLPHWLPHTVVWSPNGRAIALDLENLNPYADDPLIFNPDPTITYPIRNGTVIAQLDWPATASTEPD